MVADPTPPDQSVVIVDGALTRELRRRVLRPALSPADPLPGDELAGVIHLAVLRDGQAQSTGWIVRAPCPWLGDERSGADSAAALDHSWQFRQLATLESRRGEGLASAVVTAALELLRSTTAAEVLWCYAREQAQPLYARLGFRSWGPLFTDEDHPRPHRRMWRRVDDPAGARRTRPL